jgi:hypothetical protein
MAMETGKDREFNSKSQYAIDLFYSVVAWYKKHKTTCTDGADCIWCGMWDCPHTEPTHNWPDGCAACDNPMPEERE